MTRQKPVERIDEYFGNRGTVIFTGLFCLIYFSLHFFTEIEIPIAKILPPFPYWFFIALAVCVAVYQIITWKSLRLMQDEWYQHPMAWIYFLSELTTLFFAFSIIAWPIYFIYTFVLFLGKMN